MSIHDDHILAGIYDEKKFVNEILAHPAVLDPIPAKLTVIWQECDSYYFDNVYDGCTLIWIDLMIVTFREFFPGVPWMVDDPGILYVGEDDSSYDASPYNMEVMQQASNTVLARYRSLFARLVEAGVPVIAV